MGTDSAKGTDRDMGTVAAVEGVVVQKLDICPPRELGLRGWEIRGGWAVLDGSDPMKTSCFVNGVSDSRLVV